jgi:hypothetical protein
MAGGEVSQSTRCTMIYILPIKPLQSMIRQERLKNWDEDVFKSQMVVRTFVFRFPYLTLVYGIWEL